MSKMKEIVIAFQESLSSAEDQPTAEELFASTLEEFGFRRVARDEYAHLCSQLSDPLNMSYPKAPTRDETFALRSSGDGSNFLLNLRGTLFPLDLRVTRRRRNPSWSNRIVPSIGAYLAGELETGDVTIFLCGTYSSRTEKRLLKELAQEHELLTARLKAHAGQQTPVSTLIFPHSMDSELLYESARRRIREQEAFSLISHFHE